MNLLKFGKVNLSEKLRDEIDQVKELIKDSEQAKKDETEGKPTNFIASVNGLEDDALPKQKSEADHLKAEELVGTMHDQLH